MVRSRMHIDQSELQDRIEFRQLRAGVRGTAIQILAGLLSAQVSDTGNRPLPTVVPGPIDAHGHVVQDHNQVHSLALIAASSAVTVGTLIAQLSGQVWD